MVSSDEVILRHIEEGNLYDAFEIMVYSYQKAMVSFCRNMLGDRFWTEAEDVAHDVFIAAYKAMPCYRMDASVKTWIFSIAKKRCFSFIRKNRRRFVIIKENTDKIKNEVHPNADPSEADDKADKLKQVKMGLEKLPKSERVLLVMRYDTDLKNSEIANILGISLSGVQRRLPKALAKLKEIIRNEEP